MLSQPHLVREDGGQGNLSLPGDCMFGVWDHDVAQKGKMSATWKMESHSLGSGDGGYHARVFPCPSVHFWPVCGVYPRTE